MYSVESLLRQACDEFAGRVAITTSAESIDYATLLRRARTVAAELAELGIGKGDVVAVAGQRSAAVIEAVFGTWLAGAVVLLIDESLPESRREVMLASGAARALVSCAGDRRIERRTSTQSPLGDPDHAYVAFTSGSTGKPKAIVGSHRGLAQFLAWQSGEFSVGPGDRFAHLTNLSFDVWFRDALMPLVSGATLCIPGERHLEPAAVRAFLRDERITGLHLVPSVGKLWAEDGEQAPSVRLTFFAGEPLDGELVKRWRMLFPATEVVNLYGPTETTLAQHFHRVPRDCPPGIQHVGRNRPGSRSYVLDEHRVPCAPGTVGEIYIAADHPSHGYLVDLAMISPFVAVAVGSQRIVMYPTGDLGALTPSGDLDIKGRTDDQVKIAGVRIELQEIRAAIQAHPGVRDVFVCAPQDGVTKTVIAVLAGDAAAEHDLREALRRDLLSVMVPTALIYLPQLPKLSNGKADRKALTAVAQQYLRERAAARTNRAAGGTVAERLERIWLDVAGASGDDAAFFDVGGTSVTVLVLHAEIQAEFGIRFPLVRLFEHASFNAQRRFLEGLESRPAPPSRDLAGRGRVLAARRARR